MSSRSTLERRRVLMVAAGAMVTSALTLVTPAVRTQGLPVQQIVATEASTRPSDSNIAALSALRTWDAAVTDMDRTGDLRGPARELDPLVTGRTLERFDQFHRGVRVFGGGLTRQINAFGQTVSIFGTVYDDITIDAAPGLAAADAHDALARAGAGRFGPMSPDPELVVLPVDGGYRLTWTSRIVSAADRRVHRVFVDATTGDLVTGYDDTQTQSSALGRGTGVIGDPLKLWVQQSGSLFQAIDLLRPGSNTTYDLKGDPVRTTNVLNGVVALTSADIASDADNTWTDPSVAAAHSYAGLTYDYYRIRFNRLGINNQNLKLRMLVNPTRATDYQSLGATYPDYFNNAANYGNGYVAFGSGSVVGGVTQYRSFAGAIDVVAHEITHGVTEFTSRLTYLNESGALNEAFSDIMSAAVEFMWQPLGTGVGKSDWLEGEDVTPSGVGLRSFSDPHSLGYPDHYSIRTTTTADNGGVHTNSSIVNHAFYLAVMGGRNRVSGLTVTGVGFDNRDQIESAFYRGFTQLLTANSNFSAARAATIQAARDLYGAGSAAEVAVTQAWAAVGVQ